MLNANYRRDIDGLRAVAVLAVVLFHLRVPGFSGGFVGVDVFFVISGFLISTILLKQLADGRFSLVTFFYRRIRRVFPAAALVIATSLVAGSVLQIPVQFADLGESAVFSSLGLANVHFYFNSGYFAPSAETLPLLHFWSLGVEEQFYLVWPLALMVLALPGDGGMRARVAVLLSVLTVTSFCWAAITVEEQRDAAFFLPHLRAWELAVGALLSLAPAIRSRWKSEIVSVAGACLVAYGIFRLSSRDMFPGPNALWPCVGAAFLIWPKNKTAVAGLLSLRPIVFVGLTSYSLYLWHWPLIVFARVFNNGYDFTPLEIAMLLLAAMLLGWASWKFIERPFREASGLNLYWPAAIATMVCVVATGGYWVQANGGFLARLPADARMIASYLNFDTADPPAEVCDLRKVFSDGAPCFTRRYRPRVLLIGDSHAGHYVTALPEVFPNIDFAEVYASGCRPVLHAEGRGDCVNLIDQAYRDAVPNLDFDAVIISARWRNGDWQDLGESIEYLHRYTPQVIVFGQTMEYTTDLPELMLSSMFPRRAKSRPQDFSLVVQMQAINEEVLPIVTGSGASFFNPIDAICAGTVCQTEVAAGIPMQHDYGHLTPAGAAFVLAAFKAEGLLSQVGGSTN